MKNSKKIFWGLTLLFAGAALAVYAFLPGFSPFGISAWKFIITIPIVAFIIERIICGDSVAKKINHFIPLALLAVIYRKEITELTGTEKPFSIWLVLVAAVLLTVATAVLCKGRKIKIKDGTHVNKMSASTIYLDATKSEHKIYGKYSASEVYFQNTDSPDVPDELTLDIDERYGATEIHVPAEWYVDWRVDNEFGAVEVRPNPEVYTKRLIITGISRYGAIEVD